MLPVTLASTILLVAVAALPATGAHPGPGLPGPDLPGPNAPAGTSPAGWVAPVEPLTLVAGFDPPVRRWLPGHRGVDLAADLGEPVRAAGAGTIAWAGPLVGRGVVVVEHADGLRTTYEPVDAIVVEGDHVQAGQVLGTVGEGDVHCGRRPRCLHWGLRRGEDYLDPWRLLHPGRPVLLPP